LISDCDCDCGFILLCLEVLASIINDMERNVSFSGYGCGCVCIWEYK